MPSTVMLICIRGPGTTPCLDRLLDAQIRPARVAHGRDSGIERAAHVIDRIVELHRKRRLHHLLRVVDFHHDVDVGIDQPRQDRAAFRVECRELSVRQADAVGGADRANLVVFDQDGGIFDRLAAVAVDQRAVANERVSHVRFPFAQSVRSGRAYFTDDLQIGNTIYPYSLFFALP